MAFEGDWGHLSEDCLRSLHSACLRCDCACHDPPSLAEALQEELDKDIGSY